ncbi:MAG: threonine--tRNA ligase [Deltaproteobacteria bacterium]|nr:threonine--tRNA ligase [Deltaproteobacteria bacterium]MCK5710041.1 threonine--tRNA ligase [Deltaproteobacteria bacterium]
MTEINIQLPDGVTKSFPTGTTLGEIIESIGAEKSTVGAKVNGNLADFYYELDSDSTVEPIKLNSEEGLYFIRHTAAHIMAEAVQSLFPEAKVTIGPVIDNGFYYDFEYSRGFTPEDLEKIENKMKEIAAQKKPLTRKKVSREDAINIFEKDGETYKVEIINDLPSAEQITIYDQDGWYDLCRGPHAPSTGFVRAFKLLSSAGAYWRGSEKNAMLQRIYGTAFWDRKELKTYLNKLEEAKKRDHRKLGKELDLFSIQEDIGAGLVLWHPKGSRIRRVIEDFWLEQHERYGYELLYTPHIANIDLWKTSGHLEFYKENMYPRIEVDNTEYQLKPMNCPFHIMIYKTNIRSYRDLPLRWAEIGTVYRYERSGVLHGLLRVRGFSQDDAHIFCRPDQIEEEVLGVLDLTILFFKTFGFDDYEIYLSTRPEKFVGSEEVWDRATDALRNALDSKGLDYEVDEGGGAFYGPKIDLKIKDVLGRAWQCSTVQVDFNLPERFDMSFIGDDNSRHQPIMIHRAIFGSMERFFGILIEHYGGAFPLWLSPVQIRIATISDEQKEYGEKVYKALRDKSMRVEKDFRNEKLGFKVREAQLEKIPYLLVIGNNEVETCTVAPRKLGGKNISSMTVEDFLISIETELNPQKWREVE